jgi:hypothetical protein
MQQNLNVISVVLLILKLEKTLLMVLLQKLKHLIFVMIVDLQILKKSQIKEILGDKKILQYFHNVLKQVRL